MRSRVINSSSITNTPKIIITTTTIAITTKAKLIAIARVITIITVKITRYCQNSRSSYFTNELGNYLTPNLELGTYYYDSFDLTFTVTLN